jgi:hypothetical protein
MKPRSFATTAAALSAAFLLAACSTFFGAAETSGQKAFRLAGIYSYVAIPAAEYAAIPTANTEIVDLVCRVDKAAWGAVESARVSLEMGGDTLTTSLAAASSAMASFSLQVLGTISFPSVDPAELASKSIILASVGARSFAEMRVFRKTYLQTKLAAMQDLGLDPTAEEMAEIGDQARLRHDRVQAACAA